MIYSTRMPGSMVAVLVGLGSNIEPEANLTRAAEALRLAFGDVVFSSVYRSKAIGMDGDDFYNACCLFQSDIARPELRRLMKEMEDAQGRDRARGAWKPRTIDLDVLMYDGEMIDDELYRYAHAFVPASELVTLNIPNPPTIQSLTIVGLRL